ncbi:S9 family peptidase [Thermophagus xiamenensis]|uniref:Dipeptidyl-peptidase IV Serine peptidase. MEROPS family S09B n=1 Tax=Thermophagus xiamenensis TaxID=385682 RepID=A0A1I2A262_9BACT|nr:S9 family peptidase [Thermophagus xiamenensis]SFE37688.1 dipeptidyl-peptidase IV Serine peptidase. MEROPS family S09B [Thermophagus xiamenensis]
MKRITFILFLSLCSIWAFSQTKTVELEDFTVKGTFRPKSITGLRSMNDGNYYTTLEDGGTKIVKYSYKTGKQVEVIFDIEKVKKNPDSVKHVVGYTFSPDESKILVYNDVERIYRRSFLARYYVYDLKYKELLPLADEGKQQVPLFSPNSQMVAYVKDNNIYLKKLRFGTTSAVTEDGEKNRIINGIPDWVYEEEFGYNCAMEWSPTSENLAFVRFDESEVKQYSFPLYKGMYPEREEYALYPGRYEYKYPKAGEKNSKISVHVFNVKNRTIKTMDAGDLSDAYIPRLRWSYDPNKLGIIKLNRLQNELELMVANPNSGVCNTLLTIREPQYIPENVLDNIRFLPDGKHFVYVGQEDGYNHIHLYTMAGIKVRQVTSGQWEITDFYGFDAGKKMFYFQAGKESPLKREIYAVDMEGKEITRLSPEGGYSEAEFSSNFRYFVNTWSTAREVPQIAVYDNKGKLIRVLEDNSDLKEKLEQYSVPQKEFFTFTTSEGVELNGYMIKPLGFDESRQYPVLMSQYSGPGSQEVFDQWGMNWEYYLATKGYLIVTVDGRGTGARGEEFLKSTYLQLGRFESDDQIETARYLAQLPYVDASRIGIWGWSFGGYMTSLCLSKSDLFKIGIAVAPVTNWRYYDTVYTERFLRTPQMNPRGYDDNSPINLADKLSGKLFLIHGTADDNVHFQNTMEYAERLIQAGKQFDMFVYPNRNHSIYGGNTRHHLFTMMSQYIFENL